MKALVLIGGFGTRLRPITYRVPKQLIPVAGKPLLYHVFDMLPAEIDEVVLATGHMADAIERHVRSHPLPVPVRTVTEREPLGTGGGLKNASAGLSDPFLLMNSDTVSGIDVGAMIQAHRAHRAFGTMYLTEVADTRPYGVASLEADDRIERFVEKPAPEDAPSHWINAGLTVWDRAVLDTIPGGRAVSLEREILPGLLPRGIYGFRGTAFWEDAGTPARMLNAQRLLFDAGRGRRSAVPDGASVRGAVAVGTGVRAAGARIGPYVTVGEGVRIGPGASVENSILMDGAVIGADATLAGVIVGPVTTVSAAATLRDAVVCDGATASGPSGT